MIYFKIIGAFLIVSSTSIIGYYYGNQFSNRLNNLIYMEQCIKILETEIVYGAILLPEALINVYNKGNKKVSFIFKEIKNHLLMNKNSDVYNSFLHVSNSFKNKLSLKDEDVEIFLSLGRVLGSSDRKDQEKNFSLILKQISFLQNDARLEKEKNEKMFKGLGILIGLAIVIILL